MAPLNLDHLANQIMTFLISPKHDSNMTKSYLTSKLTEEDKNVLPNIHYVKEKNYWFLYSKNI